MKEPKAQEQAASLHQCFPEQTVQFMVRVESVVILEEAAWKESLEKLLAHWKCFILIGIMYGLIYMHVHVCMPAVYTVEFI